MSRSGPVPPAHQVEPTSQRQPAGWIQRPNAGSDRAASSVPTRVNRRSSTCQRGRRRRGYPASKRRSARTASSVRTRRNQGRRPSASECRSTGWSPASEHGKQWRRALRRPTAGNRAACSGPTPAIKRAPSNDSLNEFLGKGERTTPRPIGYPPGSNDRGRLRARPRPTESSAPQLGAGGGATNPTAAALPGRNNVSVGREPARM